MIPQRAIRPVDAQPAASGGSPLASSALLRWRAVACVWTWSERHLDVG